GGHIDEYTAGDDRWDFFRAGHGPAAITKVIFCPEAIPDLTVETKMGKRIDMRAHVGVHGYRRAGVADMLVHGRADSERVIDHRAMWCMCHPDPVVRIARRLPARHANEILDREIVNRP